VNNTQFTTLPILVLSTSMTGFLMTGALCMLNFVILVIRTFFISNPVLYTFFVHMITDSGKEPPEITEQEAGWAPEPAWMSWRREKFLNPARILTPDLLAHS
jgi:hypothetical protein